MIARMGEPVASAAVAPRSRARTLLPLIAGNLVPLAGVLFFRWDLFTTMVVFWLDSVVVGFYTSIKILLARRPDERSGKRETIGQRIGTAFFFGFFYGLFTLAYGLIVIFVFGAYARRKAGLPMPYADQWVDVLPVNLLLAAALAILISRGLDFYFDFIRTRAYESATSADVAVGPIARLIFLHIVLAVLGSAVMEFRAPVLALVLLVIAKMIGDLLGGFFRRGSSSAAPTTRAP